MANLASERNSFKKKHMKKKQGSRSRFTSCFIGATKNKHIQSNDDDGTETSDSYTDCLSSKLIFQ